MRHTLSLLLTLAMLLGQPGTASALVTTTATGFENLEDGGGSGGGGGGGGGGTTPPPPPAIPTTYIVTQSAGCDGNLHGTFDSFSAAYSKRQEICSNPANNGKFATVCSKSGDGTRSGPLENSGAACSNSCRSEGQNMDRQYQDNDGNTQTETKNCCSGLKPDGGKVCRRDPSAVDPNQQFCAGPGDHNACSDKAEGCYAFNQDHLFNKGPGSESDAGVQETTENAGDEQAGANSQDVEPLADGVQCGKNSDCKSYNCEYSDSRKMNICVAKFACRRAAENEQAPGSIECEEGLNKVNGICLKGNNTSYYLGLLGEASPVPVPGQQCQFSMDEKALNEAKEAMRASRTLEWILHNINAEDDCMKINPFLRSIVAPEFLESRRRILNNFNVVMADIEKDSKTLMKATKDNHEMVTIHGEEISSHDLAMRRSQPYDMLLLMHRRNALFQSYEAEMNQLYAKVFDKIKILHDDVKKWTDHKAKEWTLNGTTYKGKDHRCRGGGFLGLGRRKIFKRWNNRIWLSNKKDNTDVITNDMFEKNMAFILGTTQEEVQKHFDAQRRWNFGWWFKKKMFLIDPVIDIKKPGFAVSFPPFVGIFGMKFYSLSSLKKAEENFRTSMKDFYKKLKEDANNKEFIFEPDLVTTEAKNCFEDKSLLEMLKLLKPGVTLWDLVKVLNHKKELSEVVKNKTDEPKAKELLGRAVACGQFNNHLNQLANQGLAQVFSWSYHTRDNYKFYFNSEAAFRRKLLTHYETQSANLTKYYKTMAEHRTAQNACIDAVLKKVVNENTGSDQTGISEGSTQNYYQGNIHGSGPKGNGPKPKSKPKIGVPKPGQYNFALNSKNFSLKTSNYKSLMDSGSSNSAGALFNQAGLNANALANKVPILEKLNEEAEKKGINVKELDKAYRQTVQSVAASRNGPGAAFGAGMGGTAPSFGNAGSGNATLSDDKDKSNEDSLSGVAAGAAAGAGTGAGSDSYSGGALSGISAGSGSGSGSGNYQDPTGLSDEEKDVMQANLDRNKSEYQTNEDDSLFQALSKTYQRNLRKILTRKGEGKTEENPEKQD